MLLAPPSPDRPNSPGDERDAVAREATRNAWLGKHRGSVESTSSELDVVGESTACSEEAVDDGAASSEEAVDDGAQEKEQKEDAGQPEAQSIGESSGSEEDLDAGGELSRGGMGCLASEHRVFAGNLRGSTRKF